ncbi:RNA methyltransferase, putative [Plasmodium vinckei]|uniref:RNA methyltransferase, putative n=1 Tax=Plasmodium vinckei TaxID=5860 RepID=A0A6V7TBZ7_PLAVN|nr:RNA methyltransferase, putative [Plasmodium vinckei]
MEKGNNLETDKEREDEGNDGNLNRSKMYVVIYNIGKKKNIGNIVRSCVAFNVSEIFVVGRNKKETSFFGSMGTHGYIKIRYFINMIELKQYLNNNNILLYACEITNQSIPITEQPFVKNKDTAFLFGNEEQENKLNNYLNPSEDLMKEIDDKRIMRERKKTENQLTNLDNLEFLF